MRIDPNTKEVTLTEIEYHELINIKPEVDLELEIERIVKNEEKFMKFQARHQLIRYVARHFAEWGATHLNARKEE